MSLIGIDVASYQNESALINWDQVAASGVQFAIIKATEGLTYPNPYFARDWSEAKRVGLVRLAYHYAHVDVNEPEAEAYYFLNHAGPIEPGDGLAGDFESGTGNQLERTLRWLRAVDAGAGFTSLFYSALWFMQPAGLIGSVELATHGLWYASYQATQPPTPPVWPFIAIWQYSDKGKVPGIVGPCDLSIFNGTVEQLRAYGKPEPVKSPEPKQPTNDDLVAAGKLLLNADIAGTIAYLAPFVGVEPNAVQSFAAPSIAASKRPKRIIQPVVKPGGGIEAGDSGSATEKR